MHILFTRFPLESRHGGAEVQTLTLMRGLKERGHTIHFLGSCSVLLELCRKEGIPVTELSIGAPPVTKWGVLSFLWRRRQMKRALEQALEETGGADIICMLSLSEKLLLTEHASQSGSRVFWIEHDRIGRWLTMNPWLGLLRRQSKYATTICVSELSKQKNLELGWDPERTVEIPNGVDSSRFSKTTSPSTPLRTGNQQPANQQLRLGTLARLTRDKGIDLLIEAVSDMQNISLTIVGTGPEELSLRTLMERKKLTDRVAILHSFSDLNLFYQSLDVFVLPSRDHDPFGLVAAEAMSCGIATIVTDACGIAGYLTDGTDARVVKAGDAAALQEAISSLHDPEIRRRIAECGRQTAPEKFSAEKMVDRYEKLFTVETHSRS